jgi:hypothetical protein
MKKAIQIGLIGLIGLIGIIGRVQGQEMTVQAPKSVFLGDNFTIQFIVNDNADDFKGPSFKGFSLRSGPNRGSQYSSTFINGRQSTSVKTTFSYTLTADREGTFTIAPATCSSNGKKLSSESFSVKVTKPTAAQQQQRQQQQQQQQRRRAAFDPFDMFDPWGEQSQQQQPQAAPQIGESDLFARASVSKSNPYQGEQIIVTYKIYTLIPVRQFAIDKLPGNKGFWAEDLTPNNQQVRQHEETIGGRRYQVAEIRRGALFPQQSGQLSIDPLNLNVLAIVQNQRRRTGTLLDLFDDPFFNTAQAVERPLHTSKINVNVKPLPTAPEGFSGAVGSFSVKGGLSLDSVKAGEAVSYRLTVSGRGNLILITPPTPQFPESFETYDPQIQDNIKRGDNGISGSRTYEWVLIPREGGSFTIPAYKFIYFDPSTGQYNTLSIDSQSLKVAPGANQPAKQAATAETGQSNNWFSYLLYFLSALALVFILITLVRWIIRRRSRNIDPVAQRKRSALRIAKRRLKKAAKHLAQGNIEPFYLEIYRAIWGCLSDKYNIPLSQLNRDSVKRCLLEKQVPEEKQQRIEQLLNQVDFARFAPGNPESLMQNIYQQTLEVISEL